MFKTFLRRARQFFRRLYVRVLMFAGLALMALLIAKVLGPVIPEGLSGAIGAKAVDPILATLASSMLSVTIFSLTIMTTTYRNAASQWSPRTHVILQDDTTTHSVLAIFAGAFLFALVGMVLRASHFFGEREIVVIFVFTIGVIAMILASLVRWIAHLDQLGSLEYTADQIQRRTEEALRIIARHPCYRAQPLREAGQDAVDAARAVRATSAGYVQQIFVERLQQLAEANDARIYVTARIGAYLQPGDVLAHVEVEEPGDELESCIEAAFLIDSKRSFQQDPGFGLLVMAEIGLRALSPGINDPETAVAMVYRLWSMFALFDTFESAQDEEPMDRVWMEEPDLEAYFRDSFDRFGREAGTAAEVHLAVAVALRHLAERDRPELATAARICADRCAARATQALENDPDLDRYLQTIGRV